ncbi:histidinol-phosphatase [Chryseolinea sp. T2]|uniref:histidinol-phosphatase n=1 Tax=Chryseolinea sp. T2 TaxID=3129255 RepID=UPI003077F1FF
MLTTFSLASYLISILVSLTPTSPAKETKHWYKGNLHTHSYWSDGDEYPEMILDWYKTHQYDFIALSDHNTLSRDEKWVKVVKSRMYEDSFQNYLKRFGENWVTYKIDSGRTNVRLKTYPEYKQKMEDQRFLIFAAEEISDRFEGKPLHMGGINLQNVIPPQGGSSVTETLQHNIDAVLQQRKETGIPMFPHINHPNFYYALTAQDMIGLHGERFFEVYNGHPQVHNEGDATHPGTEALWDEINIAYHKRGQPLLLGLGTDDSHSYHQFGSAYANAGRGWVMVYADSLKPGSLIGALERGDFYASSGVILKNVTLNNRDIAIEVQPETGIKYTIEFIGAQKDADKSSVLSRVEGTKAKFKVTSQHMFVRARITSTKLKENPYKDKEVEMAWTQPIEYGH